MKAGAAGSSGDYNVKQSELSRVKLNVVGIMRAVSRLWGMLVFV